MKYSANRRVVKIEMDDHLLRIMKSIDGLVISVYKHSINGVLTELLGRGTEYEARGHIIAEYDTTGSFPYTLKEVVADHRPPVA